MASNNNRPRPSYNDSTENEVYEERTTDKNRRAARMRNKDKRRMKKEDYEGSN